MTDSSMKVNTKGLKQRKPVVSKCMRLRRIHSLTNRILFINFMFFMVKLYWPYTFWTPPPLILDIPCAEQLFTTKDTEHTEKDKSF